MTDGELGTNNHATLWLPPRDTWLYDPFKHGQLVTPVDSLGLVDLDALIEMVKHTISQEFSWRAPRSDIHHLQHYARYYTTDIEKEFREQLSRKVLISRTFHNWIHIVTKPSEVPSEEVMLETIRAERVKVGLARTASLATKITRIPTIPEHKRIQRLEETCDDYIAHYENALKLPPEFNQLSLDELAVSSVDELLLVNKRLGKLALNTVPVRHREIFQAA